MQHIADLARRPPTSPVTQRELDFEPGVAPDRRLGAAGSRVGAARGRAQVTRSRALVTRAVQAGLALGWPTRAAAACSASGVACRSV
jgi:hypothetical protein